MKILSTSRLFFVVANLSLMTDTATLNTSNKNTFIYAGGKKRLKNKEGRGGGLQEQMECGLILQP